MYLEVLIQEERFRLCFWRVNDTNKNMTKAVSGSKLASKLYIVHLEVKVQQNRCSCSI